MAGRIEEALSGSVRDKTVAVLGVTFKPNTDDMREAPSLVILPMLQARGASIRACDPQGRSKGEELLPGVAWFNSAIETVEGADALVLLTEWNEFRAVDLRHFRNKMRGNVLIDLRNVYQQALAETAGFVYRGVGRGVARRITNGAAQRPRERGNGAGRGSQVTAA
jgi:UDPglucose 6-dehydrogenase